jgi:fluoride exporter
VLRQLIWLAVAGAAGTLSRYGLTACVQRLCGDRFPWGTLVTNLAGCFLFGLVWSLTESRLAISGQTRLILLGGFVGAVTTFSTFAFDTGNMLRDSQSWLAVANLCAHNGLGLICIFLGLAAGRWAQ